MNSPLSNEHCRQHPRSRRWLAALIVACCTTAPVAAQSPKSAPPFKSAYQPSQVHSEATEASQPPPPAPTPAPPTLEASRSLAVGSGSAGPKSARLLSMDPPGALLQSTGSQSTGLQAKAQLVAAPVRFAQTPPPSGPVELGGASAPINAVPAPPSVSGLEPSQAGLQPDLDADPNAFRMRAANRRQADPHGVATSPAPNQAAQWAAAQRNSAANGAEAEGSGVNGQADGQGKDQDEGQQQDASAGLTLAALESMALAANPSMGRASAEVAAARGAAVQAGLPFNPSVGYEGQQIGSGGLAEQHGLSISQEFLRHEKRTLSREVACREVQMAEYRFVAQRARVLTDVRVAYYRVLRAQRQIDMNADLLQISQQALRAAKALAEAKEIARTDVLQAQIEVETAQNSLGNAQNQHQSAWNQLRAVSGQSQLQIVPLEGDLFAPPEELEFDEVLAWLRGRSPEIAVAVANVERARLYWQRQRVEPRPNVSVDSLYNFVDNGIGGKPDAALALSVPVPLYNRNQGAIQQARYQVVVAERSLAQLELALQQRLAPVYERYSNAKSAVKQYGERILPAAAEVLELTQKTFEVGEIGFTNLLIAQRTYRQLQLAYLEAAESLRVAESEIDGLLLSGSLNQPAQ